MELVALLDSELIQALHGQDDPGGVAEHGGADGIRDDGLLDSALMRPQQRWHYEPESSLAALAASYCCSQLPEPTCDRG